MKTHTETFDTLDKHVFNPDVPEQLLKAAADVLMEPPQSYKRNILSTRFFTRLEKYLESK